MESARPAVPLPAKPNSELASFVLVPRARTFTFLFREVMVAPWATLAWATVSESVTARERVPSTVSSSVEVEAVALAVVFSAAVGEGYIWLTLLGVAASAVAAFCYLRLPVVMYMSESADDVREPDATRELGSFDMAVLMSTSLNSPRVNSRSR